MIPKPPFARDLTPEEEIAQFERLKPRLLDLWNALSAREEEPYTSVVIPSLTLDQAELTKWLDDNHYFVPSTAGDALTPYTHPGAFFGRISQVSIFNSPGPVAEIVANTFSTVFMLFTRGDENWRHNVSMRPELFWPVAILFALGVLTGKPVGERLAASVAAALAAVQQGAAVVRVHDVAETVDALKVWRSLAP